MFPAGFLQNAFRGTSLFKTGSKLGLSLALAAAVFWWLLPFSFTRYGDISRGNLLIKQLDTYYQHQHTLPDTGDWPKLKQVGFTDAEMKKAYPEYRKVNNTFYELTFVEGFDGPYLMWNSQERRWKKGFPIIPTR